MRSTFKLYLFLLLCAVLYTAVPQRVYAGAPDMRVTAQTKWIMIGDSYASKPSDRPQDTWPYQFQKLMGLADSEVCFVRKSGYGYANKTASADRRFITAVNKLSASTKVKKIVILGGVNNDSSCTPYEIYLEMWRLNAVFAVKYPNAKVYIGMPNWRKNDSAKRRRIVERRAYYKVYAGKLGWKYITSLDKVLYGVTDCYLSDNHHPNKKGAKLITDKLYYAFTGNA